MRGRRHDSRQRRDRQSLLHAVQFVARRWEQRGWLHRFRDGSGLEWWELTPSGRSALKLPSLPAQHQ